MQSIRHFLTNQLDQYEWEVKEAKEKIEIYEQRIKNKGVFPLLDAVEGLLRLEQARVRYYSNQIVQVKHRLLK